MTVLSRVFMALGAVFAALSVALSAAAAHLPALQQNATAFAASLDQQQFHALGLVLVGLVMQRRASLWLALSGGLMLAGLATHPWAYPALEAVHLLGIALLVGNLVDNAERYSPVGAHIRVRWQALLNRSRSSLRILKLDLILSLNQASLTTVIWKVIWQRS